MPRIKKIDRPVRLSGYLPQSIYDKLQLELFSELEGRVPHGAHSELLTELITKWLISRGVQV